MTSKYKAKVEEELKMFLDAGVIYVIKESEYAFDSGVKEEWKASDLC